MGVQCCVHSYYVHLSSVTLQHSKDLTLFFTWRNRNLFRVSKDNIPTPNRKEKELDLSNLHSRFSHVAERTRGLECGCGGEAWSQVTGSVAPVSLLRGPFQATGIKAQAGCPWTAVLNSAAGTLNFPEAPRPSWSVLQIRKPTWRWTSGTLDGPHSLA